MRAALVGCGRIAKWHIQALRDIQGLELVAAADRDEYRARQIAEFTGGARAYSDLDVLLEREQPDVVHILTPPAAHADLAIRAMQAGAHVLVEKPMCVSPQSAQQMLAAADKYGVKLCVNHNYLFNPSVVKARQLVTDGNIGQVVYVNSYYGLSGEGDAYSRSGGRYHWAWDLPGGVFTNFLPHLVYLQLAFLQEVTAVAGVTVLESPSNRTSDLSILLQGTSASGVMTISMRVKPYAKYVDIYGTEGIVHADLVREVCTVHKPHQLPRMLSKALYNVEDSMQLLAGTTMSTGRVVFGGLKGMPGLYALIRAFYDSLANQRQVPVPAVEGKKVVDLMAQIWAQSPAPPAHQEAAHEVERPKAARTAAEQAVIDRGGFKGRVLVTGATGFLGHHLVHALVRCGAEVRALVRNEEGIAPELASQVELVCGDVRDSHAVEAAARGVDVIYHCAAITANQASWTEHRETNIVGTENVCRAALNANVSRVILMSSVIVYGLQAQQSSGAVHESTPYAANPDEWAFYLRSKLAADKLAQDYGQKQGLPVTILRLGILYGPGGGRPPGRGLTQLGPLRFLIGRGSNYLPYTYVGNAVDCLLLAAISPQAIGETYNVVDEPQVTVREVSLCRIALADEQVTLLPFPPAVLIGVARYLEWKTKRNNAHIPPNLSRYTVRSACRSLRYDTEKARQQLGWQPEVALNEGLRRALNGIDGRS
jgi:nucleoside-diphosphate-sugar epimerase/predicted dehydrogenase